MVLEPELQQELNLIALSEHMTTDEVIHSVLAGFTEEYWTEQKEKQKTIGFKGESK